MRPTTQSLRRRHGGAALSALPTVLLLLLLLVLLAARRVSGASELLLLSEFDASAVCLDGSPGGLYVTRATGADADRWVFWFLGGGWSFTPDDAAVRATGRLGSSKSWAPTATFGGILNEDPAVNPDFAGWSTAVFNYCCGSSYTSAQPKPVPYNATFSLHHRGRAMLDASLEALAARAGLAAASDVVVTGSSAGGLSALLHVDYIANALPAANVVAMPDAGMFPMQPASDGSYQWTTDFVGAISMWNISSAAQVNAGCFEATPPSMLWTCLSGPAFYARVAAPVFLLQSVVDWAQLASWAGLPTSCLDAPLTANCTAAQLSIIKGWTTVTQGSLNVSAAMSPRAYPRPNGSGGAVAAAALAPRKQGALAPPATNGGFFAACIQHEQGYVDRRWNGDIVGGRLMRDAFADWVFSRNSSDTNHWRWDVEWPGNPSCQPPGP